MNGPQDTIPDKLPSGEELLAYLDGELDPESRRRIDDQLSTSAELRQQVQGHQQAWDLLDDLPRATVDDSFARTTVEMVAIQAENAVTQAGRVRQMRQRLLWGLGAATAILGGTAGYFATARWLDKPNAQLVEDLPIIEHLDAYRNAESIEFLQQLDSHSLFREEDRP